ncbi:hypothetical protein [Dissulfurispira sp.]|uniref:hypothetical protein n=1 Tax=Dissulfurispira sp. TaxID=2817609 RepID=UPI002FD98F9D
MILVKGLTKYYGEKCALDSVSFEIMRGETFGLLGPNGAGVIPDDLSACFWKVSAVFQF